MPDKLTRITLNCTSAAMFALRKLVNTTGSNQTDAINRSIQVWAFLEEKREAGYELLLQAPDGAVEKVHII